MKKILFLMLLCLPFIAMAQTDPKYLAGAITMDIELEYSYRVRDFSHNYRGYSDLNDYLCGRKQEQKNAASQVQEIKQKTEQRAAPRQKKGRGI